MNKNKTWILLGIAILIYLVVWLVPERKNENTKKSLPEIDGVTKVEINVPGKDGEDASSVLLKADKSVPAGWVVSEKRYLADEGKVKDFVNTFSAKLDMEVVTLSRAFSSYDLDDQRRMLVKMSDDNGNVLRQLRVGKSGNRYKSRYLSPVGENIIYVSLSSIGRAVEDIKSEDYFRLKLAFKYDLEELTSISFFKERSDNPTVLQRTSKEDSATQVEKNADIGETEVGSDETGKVEWVDGNGNEFTKQSLPEAVSELETVEARAFFDLKEEIELISDLPLASFELTFKDKSSAKLTVYKKAEEGYPFVVEGIKEGYLLPFNKAEKLIEGF